MSGRGAVVSLGLAMWATVIIGLLVYPIAGAIIGVFALPVTALLALVVTE